MHTSTEISVYMNVWLTQDHLAGKQYLGWLAIREKLAEVQKDEDIRAASRPAKNQGRDYPRNHGRDHPRDHSRDQGRDRDRERERHGREREREREDRNGR